MSEGLAVVDVTGVAWVGLNPVQAVCAVVRITGTRGQNVVVQAPVGQEEAGREYFVEDLTTGAFTLTFRGNYGGVSEIGTGSRCLCVWDGEDMARWTTFL